MRVSMREQSSVIAEIKYSRAVRPDLSPADRRCLTSKISFPVSDLVMSASMPLNGTTGVRHYSIIFNK